VDINKQDKDNEAAMFFGITIEPTKSCNLYSYVMMVTINKFIISAFVKKVEVLLLDKFINIKCIKHKEYSGEMDYWC
jgi:hypothetical protein